MGSAGSKTVRVTLWCSVLLRGEVLQMHQPLGGTCWKQHVRTKCSLVLASNHKHAKRNDTENQNLTTDKGEWLLLRDTSRRNR
jgi:hypothetical protein